MRLAILGSTKGTNLTPIINAIEDNTLKATIELVLSNKNDALILEKAKSHQLNYFYLEASNKNREQYDKELSQLLSSHAIDLIVLIGFMRILSKAFVQAWQNKIINVHPSLLPAHAGLMDLAVHQAVLDAKEPCTGCTVHYVSEQVDAGPILYQLSCPVYQEDTAETLKKRVQELEGSAIVTAMNKHAQLINNHMKLPIA